jgi:alanine racemase
MMTTGPRDARRLLQWIEIDRAAFAHNLAQFQRLAGRGRNVLAVVKANAYGHGLGEVARLAAEAGADWLGVHSVEEGIAVRREGIGLPVLVLGATSLGDLGDAVHYGLRLTVYNRETIDALGRIAPRLKVKARVHLKVETGTHRQGVRPEDLIRLARRIGRYPELVLEGLSSHFANIEDTTSSAYPDRQIRTFLDAVERLERAGFVVPIKHMSCTAASILFPKTLFDMVRVGIGLYGLWPSRETLVSCRLRKRKPLELRPVLSWRARIAQVKTVPKGALIGYGCTFKTTRPARLAVIPVGYADGYPRTLSNAAHVLVHGRRAAVRGRVAMNFITADVTDISLARLEDVVTILGRDGRDVITAETLAGLAGTIPYEIVARISPLLPRLVR